VSAEPFVVLDRVSKHYATGGGVVDALGEIDASIPAGAVTAIVGVSGSGKSTLLRLVAGHDAPSAGRVVVGGRDLAGLSGRERNAFRRDTVTYVSQRAADNVFPQLSLEEHLHAGSSRRPFELLGIASRMRAHADELSGGELARASFAVALAQRSPLVVVDEPTAELDHATAADVLAAMRDSASRGQTFVVATHDPDVIALADTVLDLTRRSPAPATRSERTTARGAAALELRGLTKRYGPDVVLDDATLSVHAGELALVVGRSGSGKSTLLMLAGGWVEADSGTVAPRLDGWGALAYVPQRFGLVPELSVRENVELPARLAAATPASELFERLAIAELGDRYPAEISIGQQQRVAVARALRLEPRVLLVDEPTAHQDAAHAELVWAALVGAAAGGSACLVATHEFDARHRSDRWWQIEDGRLRSGVCDQPLLTDVPAGPS
jgi:ABC-type lipoprotein export system ATPase subunit